MGSHNGDKVDTLKAEEARTSEPTVEIKIKTLDSQTYTLSVDKCVSVTTLKEQIATVTGIVSNQQRLIFRGRVLKDDQLLSAYHVEDGHTLHLVVREPIPPEDSMDDPEDPDSSPDDTDTQNYSGVHLNDLDQIMSDFISSLGGPLNINGSSSDGNREPPVIVIHRTTTSSSMTDSAQRQPVSVSSTIPDSLTTLSQYMNRMRDVFAMANGAEDNSPFPGSSPFDAPELSQVAFRRGMPTAESLAQVLQSTRQLLINQTAASLNRLGMQLQTQVNVTDASARMSIQSNARRSGLILGNLGALLLELGRTTVMLTMGETPDDAVVDSGSAVFVNEYGPNSITVQPFHDAEVHTSHDENLRNMFNVVSEQLPSQTVTSDNTNDQQPASSAGTSDMTPQTELVTSSDEGIFFSNLLHQIMPYISQISATGSVPGSSTVAEDNGQQNMEHENANGSSSLSRQSDEHSPSETKRQKKK